MKTFYQSYILISIACLLMYTTSIQIIFSRLLTMPIFGIFGIERIFIFAIPITLATNAIFVAPIITNWELEIEEREIIFKRLKHASIFTTLASAAFIHILFYMRLLDDEGWIISVFWFVFILLLLGMISSRAIVKDIISDFNNSRIKKGKETILAYKFIDNFVSPPFYIALIIWSSFWLSVVIIGIQDIM